MHKRVLVGCLASLLLMLTLTIQVEAKPSGVTYMSAVSGEDINSAHNRYKDITVLTSEETGGLFTASISYDASGYPVFTRTDMSENYVFYRPAIPEGGIYDHGVTFLLFKLLKGCDSIYLSPDDKDKGDYKDTTLFNLSTEDEYALLDLIVTGVDDVTQQTIARKRVKELYGMEPLTLSEAEAAYGHVGKLTFEDADYSNSTYTIGVDAMGYPTFTQDSSSGVYVYSKDNTSSVDTEKYAQLVTAYYGALQGKSFSDLSTSNYNNYLRTLQENIRQASGNITDYNVSYYGTEVTQEGSSAGSTEGSTESAKEKAARRAANAEAPPEAPYVEDTSVDVEGEDSGQGVHVVNTAGFEANIYIGESISYHVYEEAYSEYLYRKLAEMYEKPDTPFPSDSADAIVNWVDYMDILAGSDATAKGSDQMLPARMALSTLVPLYAMDGQKADISSYYYAAPFATGDNYLVGNMGKAFKSVADSLKPPVSVDDNHSYSVGIASYGCQPDTRKDFETKRTLDVVDQAVIMFTDCVNQYALICQKAANDSSDSDSLNVAHQTLELFTGIKAAGIGLSPDIEILKDIWDDFGLDTTWQAWLDAGHTEEEYRSQMSNPAISADFEDRATDPSTPLDLFYTINLDAGAQLPGNIDRDAVLNDVEVDGNLDDLLEDTYAEYKRSHKQNPDKDYWSTAITSADRITYDATDIATQVTSYQDFGPLSRDDVTDKTITRPLTSVKSAGQVTMSNYIVEGMGYSATYVPMRTNLYSPDTLSGYSEDFRDNFFYKYGFYRKTLFIDTSASSAVDYYTSGGMSTVTTRVCTLRDLLESNGKDVTLYIDNGFYNGEEAKTQGTQLLNSRRTTQENLYKDLLAFIEVRDFANSDAVSSYYLHNQNWFLDGIQTAWHKLQGDYTIEMTEEETEAYEELKESWPDVYEEYRESFISTYKFDLDWYSTKKGKDKGLDEYMEKLSTVVAYYNVPVVDDDFLKDNDDSFAYSMSIKQQISEASDSEYVNIFRDTDLIENSSSATNTDATSWGAKTSATTNNIDNIVLDSYSIGQYMSHYSTNSTLEEDEDGNMKMNVIESLVDYSPLQAFAFVSLLYRDYDAISCAELVAFTQPVFMASDDLCSVEEAGQWYRNSLLNYILINNLEGVVQIDYNYACDLDAPLYMDVFGNILTESGTVVVPAASNATLHTGAYKYSNVGVGLYSCYGKTYEQSIETPGAYSVLSPYFEPDLDAGVYKVSPITLTINGQKLKLNHINQYSQETVAVVQTVYKQAMVEGGYTNYNWMAMVNIINEVLRGAPIEYIDKDEENITAVTGASKSAVIAGIKLEGLIDSLEGQMSNTLLCIPDFTRMDNTEYWVAFLIKIMLVMVTGVCIWAIYRDGVSGQLGLHTFVTCISSVLLTFLCIVLIPTIFQLTYYGANKFLLEDEAFKILMFNTEKENMGTEIAMTGTREPETSDEFTIQLDWIDVPWYKEVDELLFKSGLTHVQEAKLQAYMDSPTYFNSDVETYNDGVYITTTTLFNSAIIDFSDSGINSGLYIHAQEGSEQTASFYLPYYVFLRVLVANVNEYNNGRSYVDETGIILQGDEDFTYTTKYMAGNKLKTVGYCEAYFTSEDFMVNDTDIMHLYQIYSPGTGDDYDIIKSKNLQVDQHYDRAKLFNEADCELFQSSLWYNDMGEVSSLSKRVEILDNYARDFVADNREVLGRVSDETFIKVMALYMAVKYNQLFGVTHANALEIYNLDSNDLLRLCLVPQEEAMLTSPMSYSRYIATFGGEASVYAAAVLEVIMWLGSFLKPLCTVIVFISVVLSIFVFKVVLRRPSANLWGYFVTCMLLCATNFLHALLLKISVNLPSTGLSMLGCIIFLIFGQVCYLLVLAYVTGVACKDWSNLGANEYAKEAASLRSRFGRHDTGDMLSGRIEHHEDNWDYYNDLVKQHRARNVT